MFITLEGIEGAGKTTCMEQVESLIRKSGQELLVTREPGGTLLGEELRQLLLGHKHGDMADDSELLLMFASRAEHLRNKIEPALAEGRWVLCDRFTDATYAYQGGGRGLPVERIKVLEHWVQQGLQPDLTLLLDLPVDLGLQRASGRSEPDRIEKEAHDFFERVRDAYLEIAEREPGRVKIIDASQQLEKVQDQITAVMEDYLP